jgi:hypothetical protein
MPAHMPRFCSLPLLAALLQVDTEAPALLAASRVKES